MFEDIRQFFRENPRMWTVTAAGVLVVILVVWGVYGGFSFEIGRFFAVLEEDGGGDGGGGGAVPTPTPDINPGASSASCGSLGGTTCKARTAGGCGAGLVDVGQKTTDCDSGYGYCCKAASAASPTSAPGAPIDPSGACVFKTNFNAPEGAWFCKNLQCQLDGNPSGGQEYPPEGPASSLAVKVFRTLDETVNPADGPIHVRTVLDATPKCGNGKECYPPRDPLWTCTAAAGVMYQGRDGSDYYDCYNPIIHRTNYGPIKCCANTGIPNGDCFTWDLANPNPGTSPVPSPTPTSTPTGSPGLTPTPTATAVIGPLSCTPTQQSVSVGAQATVQASGGSGGYVWNASGGGQQVEGSGLRATYRWIVAGTKTVTVRSGSAEAFCTVVVGTSGPSALPAAFTVSKTVRNIDLGQRGFHDTADISDGQTVEFQININNTSSGDLGTMTVRDTMPSGMEFVEGSVSVEGRAVSGTGIIGSGIQVAVPYRGFITVKWSAIASRMGNLSSGPHQESPEAFVNAANGQSLTARVLLTLNGTGTETIASGPGYATIPTGPADAPLFALAAAAAAALLYAGYTRTEIFRRHEAVQLGKDQGPLDFKS